MNRTLNNQSLNDKYSAKACFFGSLAYALLLAYFPIALFSSLDVMAFEGLSIVVIAITAFTVFKLAGNARPLIALITPAAIFFFIGGTFSLVALVFSIIGAVSLLACLMHKASSRAATVFPILLTVAVYLCASFVLGNFIVSLICLAFLPAAMILAVCLSKKVLRVGTICAVSIGLLLPMLALIIYWIFVWHKGNFAALPAAIDGMRDLLSALVEQFLEQFIAQVEELGTLEVSINTSEISELTISLVFNLLPAIVITTANLLAFMLQAFTASMLSGSDEDRPRLISLYAFKMSTASAIIYLIFLVLYAMFADEAEYMLAMAALNLIIILTPGLLYTALITIRRLTHTPKASCFGVLIYIGIIMLLIRYPQFSIIGGAMLGATVLIIDAAKWSILKNKRP